MDDTQQRSQHFWTTTNGIVTAVGTLVMAITAIVVALYQMDAFGEEDRGAGAPVGRNVDELARATVNIQAVKSDGTFVWGGSGSIIRKDGLILTAAHLVEDRLQEYDWLEVGITDPDDMDKAPEWRYRAKIAAVDYALDLAVIKVDSDLNGKPALNVSLPFAAVGDSDSLEILDDIRILGFPGTGGETLTATSGKVSGFTEEQGVARRAWIKTDAAITAGSSGGMVVNDAGEIIGVSLLLGSGSIESEIVNCQKVADTNEDGLFDNADTCVPAAGSLTHFAQSIYPSL